MAVKAYAIYIRVVSFVKGGISSEPPKTAIRYHLGAPMAIIFKESFVLVI